MITDQELQRMPAGIERQSGRCTAVYRAYEKYRGAVHDLHRSDGECGHGHGAQHDKAEAREIRGGQHNILE